MSQLVPSPSERSCLVVNDTSAGCNYASCPKSLDCQSNSIINHAHAIISENVGTATASKSSRSWYVILFGQSIALSLACANASSSTLANKYQITIPTFQTGLVYMVLSFHLVYLFSRERIKQNESNESDACCEMRRSIANIECDWDTGNQTQQRPSVDEQDIASLAKPIQRFPFTNFTLTTPWYTYFLLAIMDVEANYLALLSLQHTSLSSSMLLSSLSVVTTVLLRQLILGGAPCGRKRMFGVLLCLVGGCAWLLEEFYHGSDTANRGLDSIHSPDNQQRLYIFYGDLLALSAACIFGLNDILAEYLLKSTDDQTNSRVEYLGMLGLCGAIFSFGVQVPILEWHKLQQILAELSSGAQYPSEDVGAVISSAILGEMVLLLLFVVAVLCYFYMSAMTFISMYDSTILNLSLQTCPLWAVVLTMLEQSMTMQLDAKSGWVVIPPAVFFISFTMITLGMILYESHPLKRAEMRPCV